MSHRGGASSRGVRGRRAWIGLARSFARWFSRSGRRAFRALLAAPPAFRLLVVAALVVLLWAALNWVYHVVRKPTEMFFPVSGVLFKTPSETWREYGPLFREHSTEVITAELLAALAQIESASNLWRGRTGAGAH